MSTSTAVVNKKVRSSSTWSTLTTLISGVYVWMVIWLTLWSLLPTLLGWQALVVRSDSMAPTVQAGDVVLVVPYVDDAGDDEWLALGSVVAFQSEVGDRTILHRIHSIQDDAYRTKGDANYVADSDPLPPQEVQAVARVLVPWIGLPFHWASNGQWALTFLAVASLLVAWWGQSGPTATPRPRRAGFPLRGSPGRHAADGGRLPPRERLKVAGLGAIVVVTLAGAAFGVGLADANLVATTDNVLNDFDADAWQIAASAKFTCRNTSDFEGWCWGENADGQLGNGTTINQSSPTGIIDFIAGAASSPVAGVAHTCVIEDDNTVLCWGENGSGQVGDNTTTDRLVPVTVVGVSGTGALADIITLGSGSSANHSCAVSSSNEIWCWGENGEGQLGDGTDSDSSRPTSVVTGMTNAASHPSGSVKSTCVLSDSATAFCWGENGDGQLGDGTTNDRFRPAQVTGVGGTGTLSDLTFVATANGGSSACAIDDSGSVFCWGRNDQGQLGDGSTTARTSPVAAAGVGGAGTLETGLGLGLGKEHSCAVEVAGTVLCWGRNNKGQLGDATTTDSLTAVQVVGVGGTGTLAGISQVVAGEAHSCGLDGSGAVFCWGLNDKGQLGDTTTTDATSPVAVSGVGGIGTLTGVTHLSAGLKHTCAVRTDTSVVCWGLNNEGQLGNGTTTDATSPVVVSGVGGTGTLSGAVTVGAGESHTCANITDGTMVCWGRNDKGQLGNATTTDSETPVQVVDVDGTGTLTGIAHIGVGAKHTCAVTTTQNMYCWGHNDQGQLGNSTTSSSSDPGPVLGSPENPLKPVLTVAAGLKHSCMSLMDLTVYCWGRNDKGQVGDGTTTNTPILSPVVDPSGSGPLTGVRQVVAGGEHSCALRSDATVLCWGLNDKGQLGNATTTNSFIPVQVAGVGGTGTLTGVTWLSAGAKHTCAVRTDTSVICWGHNDKGQLGDGTTTDATSPGVVIGMGGVGTLASVRQVGLGSAHSCAVSQSDQVHCWGHNNSGQLGDLTTLNRSTPVAVIGVGGVGMLTNVRWVDGGLEHTCVATLADTALCWGRNDKGQVGDATTVSPRLSPRQVVAPSGTGTLSPVAAVAAGSEHSCAFRRDSTTGYCWGRND
ncbi:MAG: signal peptidase I, partial [Acidimicrobiia bacterium]|nr:signal peptidase I [Acidimicrobiia bacterium]